MKIRELRKCKLISMHEIIIRVVSKMPDDEVIDSRELEEKIGRNLCNTNKFRNILKDYYFIGNRTLWWGNKNAIKALIKQNK